MTLPMVSLAKAEFQQLEKLGIVCCSKSAWSSSLQMVAKAGGGWRPCGDYKHCNQLTTPDRYPLPNMQDLANHGAMVFSKLDQVREKDKAKTAIITPFGLFENNFMHFGLRNTGATHHCNCHQPTCTVKPLLHQPPIPPPADSTRWRSLPSTHQL